MGRNRYFPIHGKLVLNNMILRYAADNYTEEVMTRGAAIFLILAGLAIPQTKKPAKKSKPAEVVLVKPVVHISDGVVTLDGSLRNLSEKAIKAIVLHIDCLGANKELLTTWRGQLESELLEPAQEAEFHLQVKAPLRAVAVRFNTVDAEGHDVRLENPGPHVID